MGFYPKTEYRGWHLQRRAGNGARFAIVNPSGQVVEILPDEQAAKDRVDAMIAKGFTPEE